MGMLKLLSVQHGNHSTFLTHHRKRIAVLFGLLCFCMEPNFFGIIKGE